MKLQHLKKALATVLAITLLAGSEQSLTARATEVAEDNAILNEEEITGNQEGEAAATDPIAPTGQEGEAAPLEPLSLTGQKGEPDALAPMAMTSSGKAGENATWTVEDGVLTISGSGEVTEKIDLSEEEKGTVAKVVVEAGITGFNSSSYYGSFKDMAALEEVVLPEGLTSLPSFKDCSNLTSINIPSTVASIRGGAFANCTSLTEIILPDSMTYLASDAFAGCTNLKKITANGVTEIDWGTFEGCSSLEEYSFSVNLEDIAPYAFDGCIKLADENGLVIINGIFAWCDEKRLGSDLVIPEGVRKYSYGFLNSGVVTSVTIPASMNVDGEDMERFLRGLDKLQSVKVAANSTMYASLEGSLYNKARTELVFYPRGKAGSFVIPRGVEKIGYNAISGCHYVTEVYVPNSVKSIVAQMQTANDYAIQNGVSLAPLYFEGDAPTQAYEYAKEMFHPGPEQKIYYVEGTSGWDALKAEYPDIQWLTWDGKGPWDDAPLWDDAAPENPGDGTNPGGGTENPGDGTNPGEGTENPPEETLPTEATVTGQSTTEELTQTVLSAIAGTGKGAVITVEMKEGTTLTTEVMEKLQEKGDSLIVISNTTAGNVVWRFEAIEKTVAFNPVAAIGAQVAEMTGKLTDTTAPYVPISFHHQGILPGKAVVNLDLNSYSDKFAEGEVLYLYYYNPQTSLFEKTSTGSYQSGRAVFTMEHCSDYIVTNKELSKALTEKPETTAPQKPVSDQNVTSPKTGDTEGGRMVFLWLLMVCAVAGFAALTITRRKYRNAK